MSLPVPIPGVDPGPQWATDIDSCFAILDLHNHSAGLGVQINPAGLNINSDLTFLNNNATNLRSSRFQIQGSLLSGASDIGCTYVSGVDLYFNDINGNQVRMTSLGAVAGTPGSISSLTSPASASYSAGTFVWQSAVNTPANLDAGSVIFRDISANSKGVTVNAPAALAANYSLSWPAALPATQSFVTMDNSGNIAAPWTVDGTTIQITANQLAVILTGVQPTGSVLMFAGPSASVPTGWLYCDGSAVSRSTYSALFAVIGVSCGYGNNSTTFNLPDYRGYFLRGLDGSAGRDPDTLTRTAMNTGGNTGNSVGSVQVDDLDSHTHTQNSHTHTDSGHVHAFAMNNANQPVAGGVLPAQPGNVAGGTTNNNVNSSTANISTTTATNQNTGGNETRPINAYVNFMIKT